MTTIAPASTRPAPISPRLGRWSVPAVPATATAAGDVAARARDQAFVLAYADAYGLIALAALAAVFLVLLVREAKLFPRPIPERGSR